MVPFSLRNGLHAIFFYKNKVYKTYGFIGSNVMLNKIVFCIVFLHNLSQLRKASAEDHDFKYWSCNELIRFGIILTFI